MERSNNLAENLKFYQRLRNASLAEFSADLGIARSTIQSILIDGNTTVDTLVRMANALHVSLDELVFGESAAAQSDSGLLDTFHWFASLSPEEQTCVRHYLSELFELIQRDT